MRTMDCPAKRQLGGSLVFPELSWANYSVGNKSLSAVQPPSTLTTFRVAHLLQRVGREGRTKPSAAIKKHRLRLVRVQFLDIAFNHSLADMLCADNVALGEFAFFADVNHGRTRAAARAAANSDAGISRTDFFDIVDEREEGGE